MTPIEQSALMNVFDHEVRAIFRLQIVGFPSARSEFGGTYVTLANGLPKEQGADPAPVANVLEACTFARKWMEAQRAKGDDVLVWRSMPRIETDAPRMRLWMRCHTMTSAALAEYLTKQAETVAA